MVPLSNTPNLNQKLGNVNRNTSNMSCLLKTQLSIVAGTLQDPNLSISDFVGNTRNLDASRLNLISLLVDD
jgi:hypothetical protein